MFDAFMTWNMLETNLIAFSLKIKKLSSNII